MVAEACGTWSGENDAGSFGARLLPEDAYRFARGEEVTSSTGQLVKLDQGFMGTPGLVATMLVKAASPAISKM